MAQAKGGTGCQEPFAKRTRLDGESSETRESNLVVYVVCAVVGCAYSLPVEGKTLRYVSFGAAVGAVGGIALSGAGSFHERLFALDMTAVGTLVVAVAAIFVWLVYLRSLAGNGQNGSPTWVVWLFSAGYVTLVMLLFFVLAAPIFG